MRILWGIVLLHVDTVGLLFGFISVNVSRLWPWNEAVCDLGMRLCATWE